ncbi:glycosyltransferase family 1 protein [Paenibacillus algorifonticola]|uniref:glycosyltransferase family 4 protein n=1 Tax=Paenibacillus algorifonticola TaxID=684063 RepID=UPI003D29CD83
MRLALFTDTYEPERNGVARSLGRWKAYLQRRGVECLVLAPERSIFDSKAAMQASSVERFASLPFFLYPECRLALPNPLHLRHALHEFNPTLIHVATPFNLGLCGIHYARKHQIPLIASYHTNFDQYLPFYNLQWMVKMLSRYMEWFHHDCKKIFVPSTSTLQDLTRKGWGAERLSVWSRGIDTSLFHPGVNREQLLAQHGIKHECFVVFYAGRLAPEKDVETAIEAFSLFQKQTNAQVKLVLAGDGPSSEALQQQCARSGVAATFLGFQTSEELQRWYAAADLFLFPSATETFGNVVLEAMACGTPVLCANKGGVLDSVSHGLNGMLCEAGSPASFAAALALLHEDEERRRSLGISARLFSLRKSWDTIFDGLLVECERQSAQGRSPVNHIMR